MTDPQDKDKDKTTPETTPSADLFGTPAHYKSLRPLKLTFQQGLAPIFLFALVNSVICWTCAWVFRDNYPFSATFLGFGCAPIVIALCAYLYILVNKVERG